MHAEVGQEQTDQTDKNFLKHTGISYLYPWLTLFVSLKRRKGGYIPSLIPASILGLGFTTASFGINKNKDGRPGNKRLSKLDNA